MRYSRMRDFLSRSARDMRSRDRDMRNPYGSRGGYVTSDRRGRDYDYGRMGDMVRGTEYGRAESDRYHPMWDYATGRSSSQSNRQSRGDYGFLGDMNYEDNRRGDYGYDYAGRRRDYGYDGRRDYNYDGRRDYGEDEFKLTPTEIRKWEKELKMNGGSAFNVDQVRQVAQQYGIRFDEFTPELLTVVANMMYSDYKDTVKGDISMYVKLAKDFLCDEDFDGEPEEKAYLYYNAIVNKEED